MTPLRDGFSILQALTKLSRKPAVIVLEDNDWHALRADLVAARPYGNEPQPEANPLAASGNPWLNGVEFKSKTQLTWLEDTKRWDDRWEDGFRVGFADGFRQAGQAKKGRKK